MLAMLTGRARAYSQRSSERFLARLAHAGAAERLTEVIARWTWSLWQPEHPEALQPALPVVFYVDGLSLAVYSDVLVPRGPVGKLGGKILGCRELLVLPDAQGHPRDRSLRFARLQLIARRRAAVYADRRRLHAQQPQREFLHQLSGTTAYRPNGGDVRGFILAA